MKHLRRIFFALTYALPAILFFSYYPLISFGSNATMNFELSLPLIWLVIFDLIAFILMLSLGKGQHSGITDRRFFLFSLFPLYSTISIFWSENPTRSILTTGVLWLTLFAIFAILYLSPLFRPSANFRKILLTTFFVSSAIICVFCWLQCLLDLLGLSRSTTLLCAGCTYRTFGFPHPSGFAIEPQFMGNLLLAPTLTAFYLLIFRGKSINSAKSKNLKTLQSIRPSQSSNSNFIKLSPRQNLLLLFAVLLYSATMFITMSRGAIYAYAIAIVILLVFALIKHSQKWWYLLIIPITTFAFTLTAQGIFAAISPTNDNFVSGVTKVIHQMSLGIIDLRPQPAEDSQLTTNNNSSDSSSATQSSESSAFDGYVAASTNVRLGLNEVALETWLFDSTPVLDSSCYVDQASSTECETTETLSPLRILFGVGLGGAGVAMFTAYPNHPLIAPNAIVQNEFISLLLEAGLVGVSLILLALFLAFRPSSPFWRHPALPLLVALIIAYLATLNFFSGLPNALQIYLLPPLLYYVLAPANFSKTSKG